jgi:tetratricopeptide (TPR) repeat protein
MIAQAGSDSADPRVTGWGERLTSSLHSGSDSQIAFLSELINNAALPVQAKSQALIDRAIRHQMRRDYGLAVEDLTAAIGLESQVAWALKWRGHIYRLLGQYDSAIRDLSRAIELDQLDAWSFRWRGYIYARIRRYEEAVADFSRAIELHGKDDFSLAWRGVCNYRRGHSEVALEDLDRALDIAPVQSGSVFARCSILAESGQLDEALSYLDQKSSNIQDPVDRAMFRYNAFSWMRLAEEAGRELDRMIELNPDYSEPYHLRAMDKVGRDQYEESLPDFARAIDLDPKHLEALAFKGLVLAYLDRYDEAFAAYARALEIDPNYGWAIAFRGDSYGYLGRYDEALRELNRAIVLDPYFEWAVKRRDQLVRTLTTTALAITAEPRLVSPHVAARCGRAS